MMMTGSTSLMSKTTVNTSGLERKLAAVARAAQVARTATGIELGGAFIEAVDELTNKDTNRLSNGWLEAGLKAGVSKRPLRPVVASKDQDKFLAKLEKQIEFWTGRLEYARGRQRQYEAYDASAPPRKDGKPRAKRTSQPFYRSMKSLERKAIKNIERAGEELAKAQEGDGFIFFDVDSIVSRKANRTLSTVRNKVYGGDGQTIVQGNDTVITLINKEPHARIVEKNPHLGHPVATALEITKVFGVGKTTKKYRSRISAAVKPYNTSITQN